MKTKIAIFASGNGSNFEALARACHENEIDADVAFCFTDKPGAYVVERARRLDIPVITLRPKDFSSKEDFESEILSMLRKENVSIIFLAGYMRIVGETLLKAYPEGIINIHPSLLPSFRGVDAIGQAMDYGVKVYGVTIHYVDHTLDGGKIIDQAPLYYAGNDREELEPMIHRLEHSLYVATARNLVEELKKKSLQ